MSHNYEALAKRFGYPALAAAVVYLAGAFAAASFNIADWSADARDRVSFEMIAAVWVTVGLREFI